MRACGEVQGVHIASLAVIHVAPGAQRLAPLNSIEPIRKSDFLNSAALSEL